jgi:hypothetical protein
MSTTIRINGRDWVIRSQSESRLILIPKDVPKRLSAFVTKAGNQRAAAEKLGISQSKIAKIISGKQSAPQFVLDQL